MAKSDIFPHPDHRKSQQKEWFFPLGEAMNRLLGDAPIWRLRSNGCCHLSPLQLLPGAASGIAEINGGR